MDHSPDGKLLAVPRDNHVVLFATPSGKYLDSLQSPAGRVTSVRFSPDGQLLAGVAGKISVHVWEPDSGKEVVTFKVPIEEEPHNVQLIFSPDIKQLITASREAIRVHDPRRGTVLQEIKDQTGGVEWMAFRPEHTQLAVASWEGNHVKLLDWTAGKFEGKRTMRHSAHVWQVDYSPDGRWLASADNKGFKVWNAETLEEVASVPAHTGKLDFSPDSQTLYVAPFVIRDKRVGIRRWPVAGWKELAPLKVEWVGEFYYHTLSRDGKALFEIPMEGATFVRVLDPATGKDQRSPG
jgi:WD40 repeat protein